MVQHASNPAAESGASDMSEMTTDFSLLMERAGSLREKLAASHPSLTRGRVWCRSCGHTQRVDSAQAMRTGWPKCCGCTMTIDSPEERDV